MNSLGMIYNTSGIICTLEIACFRKMLCHTLVNPLPPPCHTMSQLAGPPPSPLGVTYYVDGPLTHHLILGLFAVSSIQW